MPVQTRPRNHTRRQPAVNVEMEENGYGVDEVVDTPRLNKLEFDENDEKIINATLKAFESGSLTPLIKEELRCTIQSRRIAEGKGEMKVEFKTPVRKKEMDDDERRRALKRRQQNREAAQRFRQRQKDTSDYLTAKIRKLEKSANALTDQMSRLKEEKELLGQMLRDHLSVCSNPQHITTDHCLTLNNITNTTANTNHSNNDNNYIDTTTYSIPTLSISQAENLLSTSSMDSNLTYEFTPNTAASDTSSVFFPDNNDNPNNSNYDNYENYTSPLQPDDPNTNNTPENNDLEMQQISHPAAITVTQTPTNHFDDLNKLSMVNTMTTTSPSLNNTPDNNNIIVYDGPLDACYEEIIIDFSDEDAEFLRNDGRTRGDSCSSVDTVSSLYSASTTGSELTPINETPTDVVAPHFNNHNIISNNFTTLSAYSGIHNIIDTASFNPVPCGKTISITDDFFLLDNDDI